MSKIFKFFSKNRKTLFFIFSLGLILFSLPLGFIEAGPNVDAPPGCPAETYDLCVGCGPAIWEWPNCIVCFIMYIVSLPVRIAIAGIVIIFGFGSLIAGVFYAIVALIVTWLLGIIMSIGIVPGATNTPEIVNIGWDFARQFANLFFLLALAFIGLATVLKIREYEAKKALPTLIIIALLINFTPVIVGFVVDMGNIITNFFLSQAGSINGFLNILEMAWNYILCSVAHIFLRDGMWWNDFFAILGEFIGIVIYGLVLFIFFNLAMFLYLLIGAVFFCRTIILWILMIISPIAFLSKVFPATRTTKMIFPDILHWDKWWQTLIQWTIIGIPIGFFLYFSNLIMTSGPVFDTTDLSTELIDFENYASTTLFVSFRNSITDLFISLLTPIVGLFFLVMGMLISFKAAPEGAKGIMQFATEKGIRRGWQGIRAGYSAIGRGRQTYDAAKDLGMKRREALRHTVKQTFAEAGREMLHAWRWQQKPPRPPAPAVPTTTTTAPTTVSHAEEVGSEGEASAEEITITTAPPPPPPPAEGRRTRARRAARGAAQWLFGPRTSLRRAERSLRIGGHIAAKILEATESIAKQEIDKRMKIDKESKESRGKKGKDTKNCPYCLEEIPIDARVCPYCGERLE